MTQKEKQILEQIAKIKLELSQLGDMRPGTLTEQYNVCGKPNCRCKDREKPKKHGPYYQLSYTHHGRSTTEFVRKDDLAEMKQMIRNYGRFKKLNERWVELAIRLAKERKKRS